MNPTSHQGQAPVLHPAGEGYRRPRACASSRSRTGTSMCTEGQAPVLRQRASELATVPAAPRSVQVRTEKKEVTVDA